MRTSSPSHIVLICSYLHVPGGYEKAVVSLANLFVKKGYEVTLLILDEPIGIFYLLHEKVRLIQKDLKFGNVPEGNPFTRKLAMLKDILSLRKILTGIKPDVVIGSEYNFAIGSILAGASRYAKVFSWEHHHYGANKLNRFWRFMLRRTYPKLDAVVTLNEDERSYYSKFNEHAVVIPNFIKPVLQNKHAGKYILTVTRFNHIKGFDLLLATAEKIFEQDKTIQWKIIGYGEQEEDLLRFIDEKKLNDRFMYVPASEHDIAEHYKAASFFVLTSRNECFPLVLLEAQSCGLPCISFDCETGPRHIIQHNTNGLLIEKENIQQMAEGIINLWNDKEEQRKMSDAALKSVQQFYPNVVFERWNQLFHRK